MKTIENRAFWYDPETSESFHTKPKDKKSLEYWDSILEFKVYELLLKEFPRENIKRQQEIIIWEKSALFPKLSWVIDFKIFNADDKPLYVEAKGRWLLKHPDRNDFWKTLKILQMFFPEIFNRLIIVGEGSTWLIPRTKLSVYPYKNLSNLIKIIGV
jgi:hypothetical protein